MGSILYTIGNTNIKTVNSVAKAISEKFDKQNFDEIIIFNTKQSFEIVKEQRAIYKKYLGKLLFTNVDVDEYGNIDQEELNKVFSKSGFKVVDLTNGQKTTASLIYMAASLCNIENIYYLLSKSINLTDKNEYDYIKMGKFEGISNLAKISYFDLIYYNEEIYKIFGDIHKEKKKFFVKIYKSLKTGISEFFKNYNYQSSIFNVVTANESLISYLYEFTINNSICKDFIEKNKIVIKKKDPLVGLQIFYKKYSKEGEDKKILELCRIPFLLGCIKEYRNLSAHGTKTKHNFTNEESRVVINLVLESLRCAKQNEDFWRFLERKE